VSFLELESHCFHFHGAGKIMNILQNLNFCDPLKKVMQVWNIKGSGKIMTSTIKNKIKIKIKKALSVFKLQ